MDSEDQSDDWEKLAHEVDLCHRDAMVKLFSKETVTEMVEQIYEAIMQESIKQAVTEVAQRHGMTEQDVISNYFYGAKNEKDQAPKPH